MTTVEIERLSQQERIDLIEALWDSLDGEVLGLTEAQAREIDSRLTVLDANPGDGERDAFDTLAEFRRRLH